MYHKSFFLNVILIGKESNNTFCIFNDVNKASMIKEVRPWGILNIQRAFRTTYFNQEKQNLWKYVKVAGGRALIQK